MIMLDIKMKYENENYRFTPDISELIQFKPDKEIMRRNVGLLINKNY